MGARLISYVQFIHLSFCGSCLLVQLLPAHWRKCWEEVAGNPKESQMDRAGAPGGEVQVLLR